MSICELCLQLKNLTSFILMAFLKGSIVIVVMLLLEIIKVCLPRSERNMTGKALRYAFVLQHLERVFSVLESKVTAT